MKKYTILGIIILLSVVFVSGCIGSDETDPSELVTIAGNENNTWVGVQEGSSLYNEGISATIDINGSQGSGDKTYYVNDYAYLKLASKLYMNGSFASFKAKVVNKKVLLNDNASVIEEVYDMNGNKLEM